MDNRGKMNEINEVVILAAGASRRMGELTKDKPKCLLPYKEETILERLIRQLKEHGISRIVLVAGYKKERIIELVSNIKGIKIEIVENTLYKEDTNIYSMKLALNEINGSCVIFEADTIMEDHLVQYVIGSDFEGKSVWFTRGKFHPHQYGGILKSDKFGNVIEIAYVSSYDKKYKEYTKLTGLMRINKNEIGLFKKLINQYAQKTIAQYFLVPWIENLKDLPCIEGNAEHYVFDTFNEPQDYLKLLDRNFDQDNPKEEKIELADVNKLKHIENYDEQRVKLLIDKIKKDKIWTKPLYIEKNHNLVLDGQHRLQAALRMGLRYVPIQGFEYEDVKVWTLRKEEEVNIPRVIERANKGDIYPYKTVKHKFPNVIGTCKIKLEDLKNKNKEEIQI